METIDGSLTHSTTQNKSEAGSNGNKVVTPDSLRAPETEPHQFSQFSECSQSILSHSERPKKKHFRLKKQHLYSNSTKNQLQHFNQIFGNKKVKLGTVVKGD